MELLHERCAGLDIGKKDLKACVRTPNPSGKRSRRQEIRTFATTTNSLLELRDWLVAQKVTLVVMEATGDYWRGAFYLLEEGLNVMLVNASHAKDLPGRKTDVSDLPGQQRRPISGTPQVAVATAARMTGAPRSLAVAPAASPG